MAYPKNGRFVPMSAAEATLYVRRMIHQEARGPGDAENAMGRLDIMYGLGFWTLDYFRRGEAKTCEIGRAHV